MHQGGEILCAVTIAGHQESNRLADEANTIKGQELRHSVADARMPIAGDPRLVVEWKIPRGKHAQCAGSQRGIHIDRDDLSMRHGATDEHAMDHSVEMHVVDIAGPAGEQAFVLLDAKVISTGIHVRTSFSTSFNSTAAR